MSTRTHRCSRGFVTDRDFNAALNISRIGPESLFAGVANWKPKILSLRSRHILPPPFIQCPSGNLSERCLPFYVFAHLFMEFPMVAVVPSTFLISFGPDFKAF